MILYYRKTLTSIAIAVALTLLSGCGTTTRPYLDVGVGYTVDKNSDWYVREGRSWTCDKPYRAEFEAGLEFKHEWTVGYNHRSSVFCGGPFNSKPELYRDEVVIRKRFGGLK